ncbi:hypothetical protein A2U01_0024787 [Trifolium medium]|uniref:Uncharacterized protein n=1 Tax=Trifolium medium TaxID=97028 RepID=A0A392NXB3_9FABA|nr:hypothetical protein [Trifolium medium]
MANFVERMLKLAADEKVSKKGKKSQGRAAVVLAGSKSGPGSSSTPGDGRVSSSGAKETPQKRSRQEEPVVDLTDSDQKFMLPNRCLFCASPVVNGPRISIPHQAKGHRENNDLSSFGGAKCMSAWG